ncbi:CHAT domain-containing protein, partial [Armatimonas sp.]|uniref:CHAT domain-containing protein n=1 Tax=Armatimonas sp. TaxID=1872638 RepID=UPI00286D5D4F
YQRALTLQRAAGEPQGEAITLTQLAELYQEKQPALARHYFQSALLLYRVRGERLGEVQLLAALGHLESVAGRSREAESFYRSAIALSEQLRTDAGSGFSSQGAFFEQLSSPYVGYLTLLVEQRRVAEAFVLAQKTKARGLLDLMAGGKIDLRQQLSESEQAEEQQRRQKCDSLSEAMVREAALNALGSKKRFEAIKRELLAAEQELAVFHDTLYARHPSLGQRRAATTANLEQVAKALPAHAALLEFAPLASGRVALFVVTCDQRGKASVSVSRLAVSATELERQARGLRTACTNPKKSWRREAQRLYQVLLAPVEARLAGKTQLIFCPDRSLWDVPFAVLADPEGVPLLTRFAISYASSATTWHAAQATPRKPTSSPKLLVLANPQFDAERRFENDPAVAGQRPLTAPNRPLTAPNRPLTAPNRDFLLPRGIRLVDLPGTQREADALAKRFPNTTLYTRSKAQESIVKQDANKFQRLHLASHAFVNDASPLLSSVVLANPSPTSSDDGFLTAREIFELDLSHLELVVLSACNTARGAQHGGEGVMGLTWALFAAGCPTQVLSQWGVDDASTATLMTRFYDGLAKGVGKSAALRQAALHVRSEPRHHHPYYWAPFVLIGDPR